MRTLDRCKVGMGCTNEQEVLERFALNLRVARARAGFTQEELAFNAELDRYYISGTERAQRNPSLKTVAKLAGALSMSCVDLMDGL